MPRLYYRQIERNGIIEPRIIIEYPNGTRHHARTVYVVGGCAFQTAPLSGPPPHGWIEVPDDGIVLGCVDLIREDVTRA